MSDARRGFIKRSIKLTEPDFGLLRLQFPEAYGQIDATGAVQHRVAQLVNWAESTTGPGLDVVIEQANQLWPARAESLTGRDMAAIVREFADPLKAEVPTEVSKDEFNEHVDHWIENLRGGSWSKPEVLAKLHRAMPKRIAAASPTVAEKVDAMLRLLPASDEPYAAMAGLESMDLPQLTPILIFINDPDWDPAAIPELVVVTAVGRVVGARGTAASLEALRKDPLVNSVEASLPATDDRMECVNSMSYVQASEARHEFQLDGVDENGDQAVVGIIDGGIDLFHKAFCSPDGKKTRILALWDQTDHRGPAPAGFSSAGGTLYTQAEIDTILAAGPGNHGVKSPRRLNRCHGTHVTSIAAGSPIPPDFPGGVAPGAKLLVVITGRANYETGMPDSLGYSLSHLAALSWLDATAKQQPLVVNISMGQNSGAHDGTSPLELACDDFTGRGRRPGRAIVKSAGNMRHRKSHAAVTLSPDQSDSLTWTNEPSRAPHSVRLDAWFPSHVEFSFSLIAPGGESAPTVNWNRADVSHTFGNGNKAQLIYTRMHADNGLSRLLIEIRSGSLSGLAAGVWSLELQVHGGVTNIRLDCWVDSMDQTIVQFEQHADENRTLSVPGTALSVITVGAIETGTRIRVGKFSGYGPTRDQRQKPEIAAPGVAISAAASLTTDQLRTEDGTSMAAPHVTGAIALCFSACRRRGLTLPNAAQLAQALMNSAQSFTGTHNPGRGFGDLSIPGLLSAFVPVAPPKP